MKELAVFLRAAYGGRTQSTSDDPSQVTAKVDDEAADDRGHCQIHVTTTSPTAFDLQLTNCPMTCDLREFIDSHCGKIDESRTDSEVEMELSVRQITVIRKLARLIRNTVGRGQRYPNPNWKWICPRTANSLDRFADNLAQYRGVNCGGSRLQGN